MEQASFRGETLTRRVGDVCAVIQVRCCRSYSESVALELVPFLCADGFSDEEVSGIIDILFDLAINRLATNRNVLAGGCSCTRGRARLFVEVTADSIG